MVDKGMRWNASGFTDGSAICRQIAGDLSLEDPEILQRDSRESLSRHAKILGQEGLGDVTEPVGDAKGAKLREVPVVEDEDEMAGFVAEALDRIALSGADPVLPSSFHVGRMARLRSWIGAAPD